ncbi:MAG TPA: sodium:solute symporter [Gammaproteobacteria bacterium]|nr:sodium:solute symporter [Gammaproteobacteria bacterium]
MHSMTLYFVLLLVCYIGFMVWSVRRSDPADNTDIRNLSALVGMTTFAATLFSTFTLMGMPNFFRTHGVGAWLFLGVTDAAMAFIVLWFGLKVRAYSARNDFNSISDVLNRAYGGKKAQVIYLAGLFVFLVPYVSIQLHGISVFMGAVWGIPEWLLSLLILVAIFSIIQFGGFRAIVRSDLVQWGMMFVTVWIIGCVCLDNLGGLDAGLAKIGGSNPAWLSTPGPKGLFGWEFLVASFMAIALMPISQPQLAWRVSHFRSDTDLRLGAVGIGVLALLVILPTLFIGLYGAVAYAEASAPAFWKAVLVDEQHALIGALAMLGLLAAAMSTADSQLHALRREFIGNRSGREALSLAILLVFFVAAYALSLMSSNELILLARISFAGTALVAPMVLIAFLARGQTSAGAIPWVAATALLTFLVSTFGLIPSTVAGLRLDLLLIVATFIVSFALHLRTPRENRVALET